METVKDVTDKGSNVTTYSIRTRKESAYSRYVPGKGQKQGKNELVTEYVWQGFVEVGADGSLFLFDEDGAAPKIIYAPGQWVRVIRGDGPSADQE